MAYVPFGIIPPVVTPFLDNGKINFPVYRKIIRSLVGQGVHGLFPLGTTGEFWAVDEDEYAGLMEATVEEAEDKVPVIAGANRISPDKTIGLIAMAQKAGVTAVSVLTPYFVSQTQEELKAYYRKVAGSTDLPVIVYNNPPKTNVAVSPETIAELAEIPNIAAVKDSSQNFTNSLEFLRLTSGRDGFGVLIGTDTQIYAGLCCGAFGAIASGANVAGRVLADVYDKFISGDHAGALAAQMRFGIVAQCLAEFGSFPAAIKAAMALQGVPVGGCAPPIGPLTAEETEMLRKAMAKAELL